MKKIIVFLFVLGLFLSFGFVKAGFDEFGYNDKARIFNGTGSSWCLAGDQTADCLGDYSQDKLVMKWNSEWYRGNDENWAIGPYNAWINNEWNGRADGSGEVWKYKIVWVGACGADATPLPNGGYCLWGQFEVIMDQGSTADHEHLMNFLSSPAGYGAFFSH